MGNDHDAILTKLGRESISMPGDVSVSIKDWHLAIHASGHAILGRILGFRCGNVTINYCDEQTHHVSVPPDPIKTLHEWERLGRFRSIRTAEIGSIFFLIAGAEAEKALVGQCLVDDEMDEQNVRSKLEHFLHSKEIDHIHNDIFSLEMRLRRHCRRLVREWRVPIEGTADWLLFEGTICGSYLDNMVKPFPYRPSQALVDGA